MYSRRSELGLPQDYVELAALLGGGYIDRAVLVSAPTGDGGSTDLLSLAAETADNHREFREELIEPPFASPMFYVYPEPGGLLAWGEDDLVARVIELPFREERLAGCSFTRAAKP